MGKRRAKTYVLYVGVGKEDDTRLLIESLVSKDCYEEVYAPHYEKQVKRKGFWQTEDAPLVPGYLFIATTDLIELYQELQRVPKVTKILQYGEEFIPLGRDETEWLMRLTAPGERTVGFSEGLIEGDKIHVTRGPLRGYESEIVKIDRRKRLAYIRFEIAGRVKSVKLGLEIVAKTLGRCE